MTVRYGPPDGNSNGTKLKEPDIRQLAFKSYCEWISQGKSKESWHFDDGKYSCCWKTMERYIAENPLEFPAKTIANAYAKSLEYWENLGYKMMVGQIEKCQPAIFQMFMRNKFKWDKENNISSNTKAQVVELLQKVKEETND